MIEKIVLGEIIIEVVKKNIKNLHLSVYPPTGRVQISAPLHMNSDIIRLFAISKLAWIVRQQKKQRTQEREPVREYLNRESHYVWGKRYLLKIIEGKHPPKIELKRSEMHLSLSKKASKKKRQAVIEAWYRDQIRQVLPILIAHWESIMRVKVKRFYIQRMKTRWGSCRPARNSIRLNTELAKKPLKCLEYILVHEMVHLLEATHNHRFVALMDEHMPNWRFHQRELNRSLLGHEDWQK